MRQLSRLLLLLLLVSGYSSTRYEYVFRTNTNYAATYVRIVVRTPTGEVPYLPWLGRINGGCDARVIDQQVRVVVMQHWHTDDPHREQKLGCLRHNCSTAVRVRTRRWRVFTLYCKALLFRGCEGEVWRPAPPRQPSERH